MNPIVSISKKVINMKNTICIIVFLVANVFCYSQQQCVSDEYLDIYKKSHPELEQKIKDMIFSYSHDINGVKIENRDIENEEIIIIPVVFNIIHNGEAIGTGRNLSLAKINEQIDIMNAAFSGQLGGANTKIQFCLAQKNSIGTETTGVNRFLGQPQYDIGKSVFNICGTDLIPADNAIKSFVASGFQNSLYLNIWTTDIKFCGADNLLGYSSFPYYLEEAGDWNNVLDGIVLDYLYVGTNATTNSDGKNAVHEAGHWLGLFHVFEYQTQPCDNTSCDTEGDLICDTDSVPNDGLSNIAPGDCLGYDCNGETTTIVRNYMDYQDTERFYCRISFTEGQKQRMRDILSTYRHSIYNQGITITSCNTTFPNGGSLNTCQNESQLPVQNIPPPYVGASSGLRKFGTRIEVNDKWLVAVDTDTDYGTPEFPPIYMPDYLHIYKREGCLYSLNQSFELPLYSINSTNNDFGLILNNNEIIISSFLTDTVYIYHYNESADSWSLTQQIQNVSVNDVGTSTFITGNFLFILEKNISNDDAAIFRIYYKNASGIYSYHQIISLTGFTLPPLGKYMQEINLKKSVVNFSSPTYTGSYDPSEILISKMKPGATSYQLILELNSTNKWVILGTVQPTGIPASERIHDMEISKNFIYVLTSAQTGPAGSLDDILYLYTYKINTGSYNPYTTNYNKKILLNQTNSISNDIKLKVINDQFMFIDNSKYYSIRFFYNIFFSIPNILPNWTLSDTHITCANPAQYPDDIEIFGNLLFYGYRGISIYNISDILIKAGFSQSFIDNSDFYKKTICAVPNDYSTSAKEIIVGGVCDIAFDNNVKKEFIASTSIELMPGTTVTAASEVNLKIVDSYSLCDSVPPGSRMSNDNSDTEKSNTEEPLDYNEKDAIAIYPNPTFGFTTIRNLNKEQLVNVEVYSINFPTRALINENNISKDQTIDINLNNFQSGIYLVKITLNDSSVIYKKLIKK